MASILEVFDLPEVDSEILGLKTQDSVTLVLPNTLGANLDFPTVGNFTAPVRDLTRFSAALKFLLMSLTAFLP